MERDLYEPLQRDFIMVRHQYSIDDGDEELLSAAIMRIRQTHPELKAKNDINHNFI